MKLLAVLKMEPCVTCVLPTAVTRLYCYLRMSRVYKTRDDEPVRWLKHCSLPIICPSNFYYFESEEGGAFCLNIWLVLTICPHKRADVGRSNWYFVQKSGSKIICLVSGDERQREDWVIPVCCLHLHREMKPPWHANNFVLCTCSQDIQKDGQCRALKQVELTYVLGTWRVKWTGAFTQTGEAMVHEGCTWILPLVSNCQQYTSAVLCVIIMTHSSSDTMEDCNCRDKL